MPIADEEIIGNKQNLGEAETIAMPSNTIFLHTQNSQLPI
jgi:hypothetical protein